MAGIGCLQKCAMGFRLLLHSCPALLSPVHETHRRGRRAGVSRWVQQRTHRGVHG
jgi:hypothetical protein